MKKTVFILLAVLSFCEAGLSKEKVKEDYTIVKDILYKDGDDYVKERCRLDIAYVEQRGEPRPVVVWFHGGGLDHGKKAFPDGIMRNRAVVVTVEYRLYPNTCVDDILDDTAAAVAWIHGNIGEYGGDRTKIFLTGMSAGGYISAMLATAPKYLGRYGLSTGDLAGSIPISGHMITHYTQRKANGIGYNQPVIDEFAPVYHVMNKDIPPMLLISGDRNLDMAGRFEENDYMEAMLVLNGHKDVKVCEFQGYGHKGILVTASLPTIYAWIEKHINGK